MTSGPRVLTVNFHYVREADPTFGTLHARSPQQFSDQLDELNRRATFLPPQRMIDWIEGREELERGDYFNMTFDDGLKDHFERVAPELESRGWTGFFFSNTLAWEGQLCGVHRFQLLRGGVPAEELIPRFMDLAKRLEGVDVPELDDIPEATVKAQYHYDDLQTSRFKYIVNFILPPEAAVCVQRRLFADCFGSEVPIAGQLYMTFEETKMLAERGHVIGLHSHRHEPLATMSLHDMDQDLTVNAKMLAEAIGGPAKTVSYPYGGPDAVGSDVMRMCRDLGVTVGFTMDRGYITGQQDPMALRRVATNDAPGGKFPRFDFGDAS